MSLPVPPPVPQRDSPDGLKQFLCDLAGKEPPFPVFAHRGGGVDAAVIVPSHIVLTGDDAQPGLAAPDQTAEGQI